MFTSHGCVKINKKKNNHVIKTIGHQIKKKTAPNYITHNGEQRIVAGHL